MGTETTTVETTEFEDGSKIETTTTVESEFIDNGEPLELAEVVAEVEAVEEVADAAVTIAAIEAERDIEIATVNAEARVAEAEAYSGQGSDEEWRKSFEDRMTAMEELLVSTLARSTPTTEQPMSEPSLPEGASEVMPESLEEAVVPEPPKPVKRSRWI